MEAKNKVLERLKDIKDSEVADGVTTLAADLLESSGVLDKLARKLTDLVREFVDGLPKRVKFALKLLGVTGWIEDLLTAFEKKAGAIVAKELRDFSQPETAG